jgi:hypothetical protein
MCSGGQIVSLVEHLCHAQEGHARRWQPAADPGADLQPLLVGVQCRIQAALGLSHQAEVAGRSHGQVALTCRPLLGDDSDQAVLGLRQPTAHPVSYGKIPVDNQAQRAVILGQVGAGLPRERVHPCRFRPPPRQISAHERDRGGDVCEQARGPANRRLERVSATSLKCTFGGGDQRTNLVHNVSVAPLGRGAVQPRQLAGLLLLQASAQQVCKQLVIAPPAAHLIQGHQEQVRPLDRL